MGVEYYKRVWSQSKAKGSHKLTMLALAELSNEKTGRCDPSHETLAEMVGVTTRQIRKILVDLESAGEIEIVTRRGRSHTNQYNILLEIGTPVPINDDKIGTERPILGQENRNWGSGFGNKIGTPARENRNSSSYEPIEPITTERARSHVGSDRPATATKYADLRKLINGRIPEGTGKTPVEVFYEVWSTKEESLTNYKRDEMTRIATDLILWRQVVKAWALKYKSSHNIEGMLDWYRNGIPKYTNGNRPAQEVDLNYLLNQGNNQ